MTVDFTLKLKPPTTKYLIKISEEFNKQNVVYKCSDCEEEEKTQRLIRIEFARNKRSKTNLVILKVQGFNYRDHFEKVSSLISRTLAKIDHTILFKVTF